MKHYLLIAIFYFAPIALVGQYIPFGSEWRYSDSAMEPANDSNGNNWKEINYDDSSWNLGKGELGYGDGDEETVISSPLITSYYRKKIYVSNKDKIKGLDFNLKYDDGAILYVNGTEVLRINMPAGPVTYNTLADGPEDSSFNASFENLLVNGENVISVEIHNVSISSSDMSFDMELNIELFNQSNFLNYGESWAYFDSGFEPTNQGAESWKDVGYDDSGWATGYAQLGYGDGDETTQISSSTLTGYFRKEINIVDVGLYNQLLFELLYDDGAVIYVNGNEVWRVNMPGGPIDYSTFASGSSSDNAVIANSFSNFLIEGINVIAVEIHQRSASSSDLSFDLKVTPQLKTSYQVVEYGADWNYYDLGNEPSEQNGKKWFETNYDYSAWSTGHGELGFGDGDEATVISSGIQTAYFIKEINVASGDILSGVKLFINYDDGYVVYVNGTEFYRSNMPNGNIDYSTQALQGMENQTDTLLFDNYLINGVNTIAVEIHQHPSSFDDLSFDLLITSGLKKENSLIALGSNWEYFDNQSIPPMDGSKVWYDYDYLTNGSWSDGNAHLGYGDGDETTTINNNTLTGYFIDTFSVFNPIVYGDIDFQIIYDDGAIVYLNGYEIDRINMPSGYASYNTFASSTSSDNALYSNKIPNYLVKGKNVIGVEIHQRSASSSDLSFDFELVGNVPSDEPEILRGPYLQLATTNSMIIKYRTDKVSSSRIAYGTNLTNLTDTITITGNSTEHEVEISNLVPNSQYYYEIWSDQNVIKTADSTQYFKTYPVTNTENSLTAWILGDCGTGNNNARAVRDAYYNYIGNNHTDMMLFLGDNAYNSGTDSEYQFAIFENMYEDKLQNTVAWSCLGNHDGYSADSDTESGPYYDIFSFPRNAEAGGVASGTEAYYSFDFGNVHFIILDSYDSNRSIGGSMYNWCQSDLQNTTADWIIAFWHHPAYTKGSHDSDTEGALIDMRENFLPLLESNGVDLVLSGHSHSYERSYYLYGHYGYSNTFNSNTHTIGESGNGDGKISGNGAYRQAITGSDSDKGTVYVTTGSAGKISSGSLDHPAMYYSVKELGSSILEINGDTLELKFLRETGVVEDNFAIIKCLGRETVSNDTNDGPGSFRQKVLDACPLDTIEFSPSILNPIILNSEIIIDKSLFIEGNSMINTLSGNNSTRLFSVLEGVNLEISNLKIIDGSSPIDGGAFYNQGNLLLKDIEFMNNKEGSTSKAFTNKGTIISQGSVQVKE